MKNQTTMNRILRLGLTLALALAIWSPVQARSAEPAKGKNMTDDQMMEHCQKMKEQKQKMKEEAKAQDAELSEQLALMNRAPENKKMSLMAAILTRMVEQRIAMDAQQAKMDEEMMQDMTQCSMMKGMKAMKGMKSMKGMDQKSGGAKQE